MIVRKAIHIQFDNGAEIQAVQHIGYVLWAMRTLYDNKWHFHAREMDVNLEQFTRRFLEKEGTQ